MKLSLLIVFFISLVLQSSAQKTDSLTFPFPESGYIGENYTVDSLCTESVSNTNPNESFNISDGWWIKLLLIFSLFVFIGIYLSFFSELPIIIKALFNKAFFQQIYELQSSVIQNLLLAFNIVFFLSISVVIYLYLAIEKSIFLLIGPFVLYLLVLSAIVVFYFFKVFAVKIWSFALNNEKFEIAYLFSIRISNSFLSTFLLFFIFSALYNPFCKLLCLKIVFFIILIVFIIRLWRIFYEFLHQGFSLFYLILYLCTVEILPPLVVMKIFSII